MRFSSILFCLVLAYRTTADRKAISFGAFGPLLVLESQHDITKDSTPRNDTSMVNVQSMEDQVDSLKNIDTQQAHQKTDTFEDTNSRLDAKAEAEEDEEDGSEVSLNVLHTSNLFSLERRNTRDCGVYRMDCARAMTGCNNACYYQNCVMQGRTVRYADGGGSRQYSKQAAENRIDAGTTTNPSSPCRIFPLSQRTFDQWPNWLHDDSNLEMDEWPVAAMAQPEFSALSPGTVRNSLRCTRKSFNGESGVLYRSFRRGQAEYSKSRGGKWAHLRTCDKSLRRGDTFTVEFDLSDMTATDIDEIVPYCKPNPDCTNDGQQLHLSDLNCVNQWGNAGRMGWPYDIETMNNYKVTGENDPVEAFQVIVEITGDDRAIYAAAVSKYRNNALQEFGSAHSDDLSVDQSLTVTGLPRDLVITRRSASGGDKLDFVYGDPARELSGFAFNSDDTGFSSQFDTKGDKAKGYKYCLLEALEDADGDTYGQKFTCWFAGW